MYIYIYIYCGLRVFGLKLGDTRPNIALLLYENTSRVLLFRSAWQPNKKGKSNGNSETHTLRPRVCW